MEDCFVAAQEGRLTLRPDHVDVLLRGVDMLIRLKNNTKGSVDWSQFNEEIDPLVVELAAVLSGKELELKTIPEAVPLVSELPSPAALSAEPDVIIAVPAMLDAAGAESVRRQLIESLDAQSRAIRFDLSLTRDLDAVGLALLAAVPACVTGTATRVELVGANADLQLVLQVTGVEQLYSVG
jgi:two-component system sensor histidine kinase and response regulator WspE